MTTFKCGKFSALIAAFFCMVLALASAAAAQDLRSAALEINNYARVCSSLAVTSQDVRPIKLLNVSADPQNAATSTDRARIAIVHLESELSRFDSLAIVDPRAFGRSYETIWDVWRKQSNLVSMSWEQVSIDIVLLIEAGPASSLRFIVHNPRTGCTKYVGPFPLGVSAPAPPKPQETAVPLPPPSPLPPTTPTCGWYAIAFCRPHGNETEVRQWNAQNARAHVIDTSSTAFPNFSPGWLCVASGPHDKTVAADIERQWKASGYRTAYIKNACR